MRLECLGGSRCCLVAHAAPRENLWQDSTLHAAWTEEFSGEIGIFGETVFCRFGGAQAKILQRWEEGVHVGVSELIGENLIWDERGVHAARTILRHAPSAHWSAEQLHKMVGKPELPKP